MIIDGPTDDEIRARLGLHPLGRPETMEERIARSFVTSMPELEDVDPHGLLDTVDDVPHCPPDCDGCACHLSPPCSHCMSHIPY